MTTPLFIVGAGSHGFVVAEAAILTGRFQLLGFLDDGKPLGATCFESLRVVGTTSSLYNQNAKDTASIVVAIGDRTARAQIQRKYQELNFSIATIVHPSAVVSASASIGRGSVALAQAVIGFNANVGDGVIIKTGAVIEHDASVGAFCTVSAGAVVDSSSVIHAGSIVNR